MVHFSAIEVVYFSAIIDSAALTKDASTPSAALWASYTSWCRENHEKSIERSEFYAHLKSRGCRSGKSGDGRVRIRRGIALLDATPTPADQEACSLADVEEEPGYDHEAAVESLLLRIQADEDEAALNAAAHAEERVAELDEAAREAVLAGLGLDD